MKPIIKKLMEASESFADDKPTQHTPGPWSIREGWIYGDGKTICDPHCMDSGDADNLAEMEANARLIAAAPDYDKLLREVLEQVEEKGTINLDLGLRIEQAIAKTEGRAE